ncbi:putative signal transduction protein [gamma proteobacterium IMCC1989]|nr:putative signal transduction protein [gamma proteobacterium IMCC1989]
MNYNSAYAQSIADQLVSAIQTKKIDVPLLPDVIHKVLSIIQDPESDAAQLANILQSDPTLSGHVMCIANSAAYTPNANLVSLQQAITRLGIVEISNITIATSLNNKLFKAPGYESHIASIWEHSLRTALWSKEVARKQRVSVEAAFLCGLLHSIGKIVILQTISDFRASQDSIMGDYDLGVLFSEYQSDVSAVVANEWGLPEVITEAITYYTHFEDTPNHPETAATVQFSHQLATHMHDDVALPVDVLRTSPALQLLNLYPEDIDDLLTHADTIAEDVKALSL